MTKQEQIEEMALVICGRDACKNCIHFIDATMCAAISSAKKMYAAGYRKPVEGYWRVVSYTDSALYTHSIITCSVCGTKQATVTSMTPNHCEECGSRMKKTVLEKVIRFGEEWKGGDI